MPKPNVTRVQRATQWTASVHTLHMPKPNVTHVQVLRSGLPLWNCIGLPEGFLLRVVVSYFLVLGRRFAYLSLYLGFWTEVVT